MWKSKRHLKYRFRKYLFDNTPTASLDDSQSMYENYSATHVNTFLMITNARGDRSHSEKASRIEKKHFFSNFVICFRIYYFFSKMCVQTFGLSPWIKSIGILELFLLAYYESFPFRKCNKIENRTDGASSNINDFTLKLPICCILASGPFFLHPYYSRGKNI